MRLPAVSMIGLRPPIPHVCFSMPAILRSQPLPLMRARSLMEVNWVFISMKPVRNSAFPMWRWHLCRWRSCTGCASSEFRWILGLTGIYVTFTLILIYLINPTADELNRHLNKVFLPPRTSLSLAPSDLGLRSSALHLPPQNALGSLA